MNNLVVMALVAAACASPAIAASSADPGPYPQAYESAVKAYLDNSLKDPMSAIVTPARAPRLGGWKLDPWLMARPKPAYLVCYRVNAKNSYGGYVGVRTMLFAFVGGKIVAEAESPYVSTTVGRELVDLSVEKECELAADAPPAA